MTSSPWQRRARHLQSRGEPTQELEEEAERGDDLARSMSRYLVDRIAAASNIEVMTHSEIVALSGTPVHGLEQVRWRNRRSGAETTQAIRNLFLFAGADPATAWLSDCGIELDKAGYKDVHIVVSGGFNADRIRAFEASGVPVDSYGVGSSLIRGSNDFTADVVLNNGQPAAKVGREHRPNPRLDAVK